MDKSYSIIKRGVLFHPELDELNDFRTVVYNWKTSITLGVNKFGYQILKIIDTSPGLMFEEVVSQISRVRGEAKWQVEGKVRYFLNKMVNESVVIEA